MANLLIPKNFKFLGKDQQQLYAEAMNKKEHPDPKQVPKNIIAPKHFGKVIPLTDSNGKDIELGAWGAIDYCINNKHLPSNLQDADAYVLKNGGWFWTGVLVAYGKPGENMGDELFYTDGNDKQQYYLKVPREFRSQPDHVLLLDFDLFSDGTPFFQRVDSQFKGISTKEIIINNEDDLSKRGLLNMAYIHRKDGYYEIDPESCFPNGNPSDGNNPNARYFWQVNGDAYLGLLRRVGGDDGRGVGANWGPSVRRRVLVYE